MNDSVNQPNSQPNSDSSAGLVTEVKAAAPAVTLTQAAASRVQDHISGKPDVTGLRFGVQKNGCSGFGYVIDFATEVDDDADVVFESRGVRIVVDQKSLLAVAGTEIDYGKSDDGLSETFQFRNPNSTGSCGCGESFSVS